MKQLTFELEHSANEWWKVSLITGERSLATESEVEMWCAMIEMANAPRDPVIIEQPTASVNGPTLTKNEASRIMNGTSYIYDQLDIMGQIVNIRAFPGITAALQQAALIYDFIGKRWGIQPKARRQAKAGEPSFADVINAEMKKQATNPEPAGDPETPSVEELTAAREVDAEAQAAKGGDYASW